MPNLTNKKCVTATTFGVSALSFAISSLTYAQEVPPPIEEVMVLGRLQSGAESLAIERMDQSVAVDILGFDQISRVGDSNVAAALRRIPGITLVDDKFVYVRGLGERYSSTLLNGAAVPSPDLTRSVIPLDIFPTAIVSSLSVQKVYSANMPGHFAGGAVDIRTTSIPDDIVASFEIGTSSNTASTGDFLSYNGDDSLGADKSRGFSQELSSSLNQYRGNIGINSIQDRLELQGNDLSSQDSFIQAQRINRDIALELNRDSNVKISSAPIDRSIEGALGNKFYLPKGLEFGVITNLKYDKQWRNKNTIRRQLNNPDDFVAFEKESTATTNTNASLAMGLDFNTENSLKSTHIVLRNTDDSTIFNDEFGNDGNNPLSGGEGERSTSLRFEERFLRVNQLHGTHEIGSETLDQLNLKALSFLTGLKVDWFISDSKSTTDIPNEISLDSRVFYDIETRTPTSSQFSSATNSDHRFTKLNDKLDNEGITLTMPFEGKRSIWEVSAGINNWQKVRTYNQIQLAIQNNIDSRSSLFELPASEFFSDVNIQNPDNSFFVNTVGSNNESYIATVKNGASFANLDVTLDETWRINLGARQENYQQLSLPWNPLAYDRSPLIPNPNLSEAEITQYFEDSIREEEDTFGSIALTYMSNEFWADDFQLRVSFAQTAIRPDLRELSLGTYIDPLTDFLVKGDRNLESSYIDHFDIRAEWFFGGGDNLTVSLFSKDIEDPIEYFQIPASGGNTALEVLNAESASVAGIEVEFLKSLGDWSTTLEPFFMQGNVTLLDHELTAGAEASSPTNEKRGLQGASDYAVNLILGFDSIDSKHAATMAYNVSGERLFFAGRLGQSDAMEQPFNSLDATYSYYPTDEITIKAKLKNILDEDKIIERANGSGSVEVFEREVGRTFSLEAKYAF